MALTYNRLICVQKTPATTDTKETQEKEAPVSSLTEAEKSKPTFSFGESKSAEREKSEKVCFFKVSHFF